MMRHRSTQWDSPADTIHGFDFEDSVRIYGEALDIMTAIVDGFDALLLPEAQPPIWAGGSVKASWAPFERAALAEVAAALEWARWEAGDDVPLMDVIARARERLEAAYARGQRELRCQERGS